MELRYQSVLWLELTEPSTSKLLRLRFRRLCSHCCCLPATLSIAALLHSKARADSKPAVRCCFANLLDSKLQFRCCCMSRTTALAAVCDVAANAKLLLKQLRTLITAVHKLEIDTRPVYHSRAVAPASFRRVNSPALCSLACSLHALSSHRPSLHIKLTAHHCQPAASCVLCSSLSAQAVLHCTQGHIDRTSDTAALC